MASKFYSIQDGDTLGEIAKHFGVDVDKLATANELKNKNKIRAGQVLEIPYPESTPKEDKYVKPEPTKAPMPEGTSFPEKARGGPMPEPSPFHLDKDAVNTDIKAILGPMAVPVAIGMSLGKAGMNVYDLLKNQTGQAYDPTTGEVHSSPQAVKAGMDAATLTMGGGPMGSVAPRGAATHPLPQGRLRELRGADSSPGTGTLGLWQRNLGNQGVRGRMMQNPEGIDPMWYDAVAGRGSDLKNTPDAPSNGVTLGSGPTDNVVRFDPSQKKLTDPKTNLERRMARRGSGNQVLGEDRFHQANVDRYAREAMAGRQIPTITPSQKQMGQAARNKPLVEAKTKEDLQARIERLRETLKPGEFPDPQTF